MINKYRCMRCRRQTVTAADDASGLCLWCRIDERNSKGDNHG